MSLQVYEPASFEFVSCESMSCLPKTLRIVSCDVTIMRVVSYESTRILESLAGCRTMVIFAVFCKIGTA